VASGSKPIREFIIKQYNLKVYYNLINSPKNEGVIKSQTYL